MNRRRLVEVEPVSADCILSVSSVERLTQPSVTEDAHRSPGLPLGDPKGMALFAALTLFLHLPNGFRNRDLRNHIVNLFGVDASEYPAGKMIYDLRRLPLKGIISKIPDSTQYFMTPYGYRGTQFLTRLHARLFRPGFASFDENLGAQVPTPLRRAMNKVNDEIDKMLEKSHLMMAA
jgi:hypothetical protein